ncbi:hypothetical protein TeGR_g4762, partial [Tetraparma gracilis]
PPPPRYVFSTLLTQVRAKKGKPSDLFARGFLRQEDVWRAIVFSMPEEFGADGLESDFCKGFVEEFLEIARCEDAEDEIAQLVFAEDFQAEMRKRAAARKERGGVREKAWKEGGGVVEVVRDDDEEGGS